MGLIASRGIEFEDSYRSFSEKERQILSSLFEKLATTNEHGVMNVEIGPFRDHVSWLLPEPIINRFFKEMDNIQQCRRGLKNPLPNGHVGRVAFFVSMSHVFKQGSQEKAHVFYLLTADSDQVVTNVEVEDLCKILLDCYVTALKKTSRGAKWKLQTNPEANHRFAKNAIKDLLGSKVDPSCVACEEFLPWFNKFPLIEKLFLATMRASFIDVDSLVDEGPHGLLEGCEETTAHVQYDRPHILMPCKFEVDFSKIDPLLDVPSIVLINNYLPVSLQHQWRLLFSTQIHGESFNSFIHQITNQGPVLIVVQDTGGHVFGGFASMSWSIKSHFVGDSHCFLFSVKPTMGVYQPTGYNENYMYLNRGMQTLPNGLVSNVKPTMGVYQPTGYNENYMYLNRGVQTLPNGLGMGGQLNYYGLWLDDEFGTGHSRGRPSCTTYGSPPLAAQEDFKIDKLEAWGVGVPSENELEKKSVLDTEVEAKAFLEVMGKTIHSEGYREPETD